MTKKTIFTRMLKGTAVYWPADVADGFGGFTIGTPVEIACRWEHKTILYVDSQGQEKQCNSVVYVQDTTVDIDYYLWEGALADLTTDQRNDPLGELGTNVIKQINGKDIIPNFKHTKNLRVLYL